MMRTVTPWSKPCPMTVWQDPVPRPFSDQSLVVVVVVWSEEVVLS